MNLMKLLFSGALVASMGLISAGCNENTVDPIGGTLGTPSSLMATSMSKSSVMISWTRPSDTGVTFLLSWKGTALGDSASTTSTTTSATATNLKDGEYTFYVRTVRGTESSNPVTIKWAGAERHTQDAAVAGVTIRMYEFISASGSGLVLDPALGGPKNVSVASFSPLSNIQLAMYAADTAVSSFVIGPAYALTQFANADQFNQQTFISRKTFVATSLNDWTLASSLDTYIDNSGTNAGNIIAFTLPQAQTNSEGQGFIVRTGTSGAGAHYARVFIKNVGGKLLQGTKPNRYVELEISYQTVADLPYAKGVVRRDSPTGVYAKPMN